VSPAAVIDPAGGLLVATSNDANDTKPGLFLLGLR
jgi:hypothetical protein